MTCQNCGSSRIVGVNAKTADRVGISVSNNQHVGYVPDDLGIGSGDYINFDYCLECGQIEGEWPLPTAELEIVDDNSEEQ